ncbi:MAG: hypothetical protein ACJAX4_000366 [Clostridium sp.]|jgi:uncharacterized protein YyaL (SSP411 family)
MTKSDTIKENRKPNKLINEKSPYLLQHAYNPVNWNPGGEEAFAEAKTNIPFSRLFYLSLVSCS